MKKIRLWPVLFFISLIIVSTVKGESVIMPEDPYTQDEKEFLLNLARATLCTYLKTGSTPPIDESTLPENLRQKSGCFVTLDKRGQGLRGCIGYILPVEKLYKGIINRAVDAATNDPRFNPVQESELKNITIEISILTVPREIKFNSVEELLNQLKPLRDGVVLQTPYGSSTYLPQVWEQLPDKEMFLSSLCAKHGAPPDTWRTVSNIVVSTYQAIVFHEDGYGRQAVVGKDAVAGKNGATIVGTAVWGKKVEKKTVPAETPLEPLTILSADSDIVEK